MQRLYFYLIVLPAQPCLRIIYVRKRCTLWFMWCIGKSKRQILGYLCLLFRGLVLNTSFVSNL